MSHGELLHQLAKIETIAEDILSDKQQVIQWQNNAGVFVSINFF